MKITNREIHGQHKKISFVVKDQFLYIGGVRLTKELIKDIVDICTLLDVEGLSIRESEPPFTEDACHRLCCDSDIGDSKNYDNQEEV